MGIRAYRYRLRVFLGGGWEGFRDGRSSMQRAGLFGTDYNKRNSIYVACRQCYSASVRVDCVKACAMLLWCDAMRRDEMRCDAAVYYRTQSSANYWRSSLLVELYHGTRIRQGHVIRLCSECCIPTTGTASQFIMSAMFVIARGPHMDSLSRAPRYPGHIIIWMTINSVADRLGRSYAAELWSRMDAKWVKRMDLQCADTWMLCTLYEHRATTDSVSLGAEHLIGFADAETCRCETLDTALMLWENDCKCQYRESRTYVRIRACMPDHYWKSPVIR